MQNYQLNTASKVFKMNVRCNDVYIFIQTRSMLFDPFSATISIFLKLTSLQQALPCLDDFCRFVPILDGRPQPTSGLDVHARVNHGHLSPCQGSRKHQLVHVTKMTNSEDLGFEQHACVKGMRSADCS